MSDMPGTPKWDKESVLDRLGTEEAETGGPVEAQLFLEEDVAPETMAAMVKEALDQEGKRQGVDPASISVGRARLLSRSIVARAPVAVLRGVMNLTGFKALLPANPLPEEAMIKPVRGDELGRHPSSEKDGRS